MKRILIACAVLMVVSSCAHEPAAGPIVIGGITPLTEQGTVLGKMMKNVADLRVSQINEAGGIKGRNLEIMWRDGKCSGEEAALITEQLIEEEDIKIIFGGVCSQETLGAGRVANEEKIFLISPMSTSPEISKLGEYSFRTMLPSSTQGRHLGRYSNKAGYRRVGVFQDKNSYTEPIRENFKLAFMGDEIFDEILPWGRDDYSSQIKSLISKQPDVIFINLQSPELFAKLIAELTIINSDIPLITNQVGIEGLSSFSGNEYIQKIKPMGALFYIDQENLEFQEFEIEYTAHYGIPLDYRNFAGTTLDAVDVLAEVLTNVDNVRKPRQIRDAFWQVQMPGFSGPIIFNANGDIRGRNSLLRYDGFNYEVLGKEPY